MPDRTRQPRREPLVLTAEQRSALEQLCRRGTGEQRMILRARIILAASEGEPSSRLAKTLGVRKATALQWIGRFRAKGLDGLKDAPRSGRPKRYDDQVRLRVGALAVEDPKAHDEVRTRWTVRSLARAFGKQSAPAPSRSSVGRMLKAAGIRTNRSRFWLFSKDPEFESKVAAIAGVLADPPEDALVLSVDEKTSIQALERLHQAKAPGPGRLRRVEHGYKRHGTVDLIAAYAPRTGEVFGLVTSGHTHIEFGYFLQQLLQHYPTGKLLFIMDNLSVHKHAAIRQLLDAQGGRVSTLFTPTHASWINPVEGWFSIASRRVLVDASFVSREQLADALYDFIDHWSTHEKKPLRWRFRGFPARRPSEVVTEPTTS